MQARDSAGSRRYPVAVTGLRHALRSHPTLAALMLAAALLLRVLVPAGYMPSAGGGMTLTLCPGTTAAAPMASMPGMAHHDDAADKAQGPCAFADLALPALGAPDSVLLDAALAFVLAAALRRAIPLPPRPAARLRPPLRGPPLPV